MKNNYVTAVGFQSDATGWGSIAIGSNATAENTKKTDTTVEEIGDAGTSGTVADDVYGIKSKPSIEGASVALGYNAHSKDGNIAIGSYSVATDDASTDAAAYTKQAATGSYLSVGGTSEDESGNKTTLLRRITNVADGADTSDVATVGQLQQAITDTGVNNKANIDASNIGANLKQADGTTAAASTDITTNENAWGVAIGTGKVADPTKSDTNDPSANGSQQLVTGGTVYTALQQQANNLKVNAGWGINVADVTTKNDDNTETTTKNVISLNRNLGTNLDTTGQVKLTAGDTGLVLGTVVKKDILTDGNDMSLDFQNFGATGDYAVTVGGDGLMATGKYSAALGGYLNKASGERSTVSGGYKNTASGQESSVSGGFRNTASGIQSSVSGGYWNEAKGRYSSVSGGYQNTASGENSSILGGMSNTASGYHAVVVGGENNTASKINDEKNSSVFGGNKNTANGQDASVVGGLENVASGTSSVVAGGDNNDAIGERSAVLGGRDNTAAGIASTASGGIMNAAIGQEASVLGGSYNYALGTGSTSVGGLGREYDKDNGTVSYDSTVNGNYSVSIAGGSTGKDATGALAAGHQAVVTTANGTAIGYQATTDEANTIAFGHDAGDVSGYTINWKKLPNGQTNADGTTNDYTQAPESVTETTYTKAGYNRLVKVADGQKAHDTVVMEQLKPYTKSDASNIGAHLNTYTVGDDGETITEADATAEQKTANKNAWGQALGAGTLSTADAAKNSDQLITGKTLYNYDAPVAETGKTLTYVSANNTTGQNLSALDAQVKANADTLKDKTHNIKYYSVNEKLPKIAGYSNEANDGAKGMGSIAAGFNTHADGIASTVTGSYSGVLNQNGNGGLDLRGATALSYGTFNINQNTDATKEHSGVANSIVGQANATTDSNAAIIYGAGNTVTNSYRAIDTSKFDLSKIQQDLAKNDAAAVAKDLQDAVPTSGGQVMVMGGGNTVDNAYMTQVTGVGNTVTGSGDAYSADSSQLNYVEGFYTTLTNGKNDYLIGANNTVTGDTTALNQSNIVFGDNHKLTNQKNNVIIGSSDTADDETKASDVVAIGHNAKVSAEGGVAIGSGSVVAASTEKVSGYDPTTKAQSTDKTSPVWNATTGAVSIGTAGGTVTRQINGVAAGTNDTDAVNVAQLKKLEGMKANVDASNIGANLKGADGKTAASDAEKTANENAWGKAIGTGKVADPTQSTTNNPTQNGSQQLVTGGEVYKALHGGLDDVVFGHDGKDGKDGSIGLVGPKGQDGKDGKTTTIIKTETGAAGVNGKDGKDGITRIYYYDQTNTNDKHTVATLDDGMKYAGDTGDVANVKLDHQLKLSGTTFDPKDKDKQYKADDWTSDNIAVVSSAADEKTGDATMYLKLNKDLNLTDKGSVRFGDKNSSTTLDASGLTIKSTVTKEGKPETVNGPSMTKDGINGGGKQITNVGDGIKKNEDGSYTISDTDKKNAANIGDVQTIVDKATKDLTDGANGLNSKANVDASNIGSNITVAPIYQKDEKDQDVIGQDGQKVIDQKATEEAEKAARTANENAWGKAIGTGKVADPTQSTTNNPTQNGSQQLVTGGEVYKALHGGLDDVVFGHDGKDGKDGSIGLVGPKGQDGKDGKTTTIIKTETGAAGVNGKDGKDGITRIYYYDQTNTNDKHTVATLDDGMKYAGDTGDVANVKLDHQLKLSGTTFDPKDKDKQYKADDWTSDNIAVVSSAADEKTGDATMYLKLNKDLNLTDKGSVRFGDKNSSTTLDASGLTIKSTVTKEGKTEVVSGPSMTKDGIDGGSKAITNIGSGIEKDDKGNYTDKSKSSAANIGDVQTIVNDAKKDLTDGKNGLNSKANVDASNIGENLKDADGKAASTDAVKKNKDAWASAIGTNEVKEGNKQLVTSDAVAKELVKKADKSYVDQELGKKADKTYVDEKLNTKANKSDVYTKNETYSKSEVDSKVTDITKGLDGKAGKDLDNISDKGKTAIHNIAKDAVEVVDGVNTTVTKTEGTDTTPTKYAVNVEGKGKVASGDMGLISGDTLYKEVHVDQDGSYVKGSNTVGKNLSSLDTGLKTTSDLIHTNDKGDTIQIGGNSTATKIDVSGKDANGNTTGRVITGVVSDANDPSSAANVGYVNGLTAANTQQIYRDMNNAYSRLDTNINRAAAGSNALAALHPLDFDPADKASFAVGYGHYHNANAAAVGAFYQPNANTMVNMGISLGNGDPGFNAGVSFKIGKGSAYNGVSKAEMAQTIHDQAAEISTIKANDAAKDKRIDALEKENQEMKKQIQEILARLNG